MSVAATSQNEIAHAVERLGSGPLCESKLVQHVHPLFSRVLARDEIYLAAMLDEFDRFFRGEPLQMEVPQERAVMMTDASLMRGRS